MNLGWPAVAVLVPLITTTVIVVWKLAKFEERFVKNDDCENKTTSMKFAINESKLEFADTKEDIGRLDERIQTLFKITERQEAAVDKIEDIIRRNGRD